MALERSGRSQAAVRTGIGAYPGEVAKLLYGDRLPRLELAVRIEAFFGNGEGGQPLVPVAAWTQPPAEPFAPPAVEAARQALAELAEASVEEVSGGA